MATSPPVPRLIFEQAKALEQQVRSSLESQDPNRFISDENRMETYNLLLQEALECYPSDPMLLQMSRMPDRTTQSLTFGRLSRDMQGAPSQLLLERVTQLVNRLEVLQSLAIVSTPWPEVDQRLTEAATVLLSATELHQFQNVGLQCREALISLGEAIYDPAQHHKGEGPVPSRTESKRRLEAVLSTTLPGESNEAARSFAKGAVALANTVTHKSTASRRHAGMCFQATLAVVRFFEEALGPGG